MRRLIPYVIGLASLVGCSKSNDKVSEVPDYFMSVPSDHNTGMSMATEDFDGDGDLDLIVGACKSNNYAFLYLFENDGEGNFKLRKRKE